MIHFRPLGSLGLNLGVEKTAEPLYGGNNISDTP